MRIHTGTGLVLALLALLAAALPALAVELKSHDITQDGKRVTLHLRFSAAVKYELVAQYAKNQVILHVDGLKLSAQQRRSGIAVKGNLKEAVNGVALEQPKDQPYGEIRLQLEKGFDPGDAQIIPRDGVIDIQFIVSMSAEAKPVAGSKPVAQQPASADDEASGGWTPPPVTNEPLTTLTGQRFDAPLTIAANTGDDPVYITDDSGEADEKQDSHSGHGAGSYEPDDHSTPGIVLDDEPVDIQHDSGFVPEPADEGSSSAPLDRPFSPEELAAFSGLGSEADDAGEAQDVTGMPSTRTAQTEAAPAANPAEDGSEAEAAIHSNETSVHFESPPAVPETRPVPPPVQPAADPPPAFTPGPSYRQRDLGTVAVNQREFRNLPFREAIMELVAGTGFNVVVGPGIDNETVYLNFKQQELSLKSALETLCTVYELAYSVSDDIISITLQS